jgi:hypothetical protein
MLKAAINRQQEETQLKLLLNEKLCLLPVKLFGFRPSPFK